MEDVMGTYLKQTEVERTKKKREPKKITAALPLDRAAAYAESDEGHSRCMEEALDRLKSVISTYVTQARNGDNGSGLYTDPSGYPVKIALDNDDMSLDINLYGDALDSIAESLKRIADAMAGTHTGDAMRNADGGGRG
jgi:hypothetical protein